MTRDDDDFFLPRWSRRKALAQRGEVVEEAADDKPAAPPTAPTVPAPPSTATSAPVAERTGNTAPATAPAAAPAVSRTTPPPPPTLDDVAKLTRDADFSRFVARDVDAPVRHAALKKLFSDPHFNVMDGLDTYIDDYGRPDPLPASMLRRMVQARGLGLFQDESGPALAPADPGTILTAGVNDAQDPHDAPTGPPQPADADAPPSPPDEDPDLQLQPHDAAGPAGDQRRAGEDPRRLD